MVGDFVDAFAGSVLHAKSLRQVSKGIIEDILLLFQVPKSARGGPRERSDPAENIMLLCREAHEVPAGTDY